MGGFKKRVEIEELLAHADWVCGVARSLVPDPSSADDLVQDTWLAALKTPLGSGHNLRGWLRQVLRNQARQRGRQESRRARREQAAARTEATRSVQQLTDRAALQHDVVRHVLALDEPSRSVVLLRFFEDLSPAEIAEHLAIPLKTVHSRLQRAFEKLRLRLRQEYGDHRSWCVALGPLIATSEAASGATAGGILATAGGWFLNVNTGIGVVLGIGLVGGLGYWSLASETSLSGAKQPSALEMAANPQPTSEVVEATTEEGPLEPASKRTAMTRLEPEKPLAQIPPRDELLVTGRAVNLQGAGIGRIGIALAHAPDDPLTNTAMDGSFTLQLAHPDPGSLICLTVQSDEWITLRQGCVDKSTPGQDYLVVAVPVTRFGGWVQNVDGVSIQDAEVSLNSFGESFFGFPHELNTTSSISLTSTTDSGGEFSFECFPRAPGLQFTVRAKGYVSSGVSLDEQSSPLVIQLDRVGETDQVYLEGLVLDENGFAVEGARVKLGDEETTSDRLGLFRIPVEGLNPATALCAGKEGHLPVLIADFAAIVEQQGGRPKPVELVLGGPPTEIYGRVVDANGDPCVGWLVTSTDETIISQYRIPVTTAEGLARGRAQECETDGDGRFELHGLFAREYVLQAYDPATLFRVEASIMGGNHEAVLRAERRTRDRVAGVVTNALGRPLPDVQVQVALDTFRSDWGRSSKPGARTVTDAGGKFAFQGIPADYVYLQYRGENILSGSVQFEEYDDETHMEIVVVQECRFRIELSASSRMAVSAELYDAEGQQLQVNRYESNAMSGSSRVRLVSGASEVLSVIEGACRVLLFDAERKEVSRHDIALDTQTITVLRL